jgi:hypothetical protein
VVLLIDCTGHGVIEDSLLLALNISNSYTDSRVSSCVANTRGPKISNQTCNEAYAGATRLLTITEEICFRKEEIR